MVEKCPSCGKALVKYPVKGQQDKSLLENFNERTIILKNLWKIDWMQLAWVAIILLIVFSFNHTVDKHMEVIENVCDFNTEDNCCELGICDEVIEDNCCWLEQQKPKEKFVYEKDMS